jgi:sec-independent protein translocase protein TatB
VFDLSPEKIILLGIIALVVLGPNRLPQAARQLGHFVGQMRRMTSTFHSEMRDALGEPMDAFTNAVSEITPRYVPGSIRRALIPTDIRPDPSPTTALPEVPPASSVDIGGLRPPDDPSLN